LGSSPIKSSNGIISLLTLRQADSQIFIFGNLLNSTNQLVIKNLTCDFPCFSASFGAANTFFVSVFVIFMGAPNENFGGFRIKQKKWNHQ
jgi:hypothetical protein